jgi:hypothetical protein
MVNKSCRKHFNHFVYATLANRAKGLFNQTVIATYSVLAWHYYRIFLLHFTKHTLLFICFESLSIINVELAFIYQVSTQFELGFIF